MPVIGTQLYEKVNVTLLFLKNEVSISIGEHRSIVKVMIWLSGQRVGKELHSCLTTVGQDLVNGEYLQQTSAQILKEVFVVLSNYVKICIFLFFDNSIPYNNLIFNLNVQLQSICSVVFRIPHTITIRTCFLVSYSAVTKTNNNLVFQFHRGLKFMQIKEINHTTTGQGYQLLGQILQWLYHFLFPDGYKEG